MYITSGKGLKSLKAERQKNIIMNISSRTIDTINQLGYKVLLQDNTFTILNNPDNATIITITRFNPYLCVSAKAPKKEITVDWLLGKVEKNNLYENLSTYLSKLIDKDDYSIYATSYGIGLCALSEKILMQGICKVRRLLTDKHIEYRTELSEGGLVYRFVVSKDVENIERIKSL